MELDAVTFLSLLLFLPLATFYLSYHLHRRRGRLPPSPPALPLVGHLHLLTSMPHHALARLSNQLGPIFSLRLGRVPSVVVASPRLAREVLKTHDAALASRPALLSAQYLSFGCSDVTLSPAGPYWRQARRLCVSELLAPRRVAAFRLIRCQEVHRLLRSISSPAAAGSDGQAIDLSAGFLHLANDVLCRVAFGRRFSTAGFRLPEVLAESQALFAGFTVGDFFPGLEWVNWVTGLRRRLEKNRDDLSAVFDEIIADHHHRSSEVEDFLDVLLCIQKSSDLEVPITDDNLKALVLGMEKQIFSPCCSSATNSSGSSTRKRSEFLNILKSAACLHSSSADTGKGRSKKSGNKVTHGFNLVEGKSGHEMEDYHVAAYRYEYGHELGLFAIFDGHLGDGVPSYLKDNLFNNILTEPVFWTDPETAIKHAYRSTNKYILENSTRLGPGGSTAVTAIVIDGKDLWIANIGDSRAVLCERGAANQLTVDHEPNVERQRIEQQGGFVTIFPGDVPRVNGQLAVARAFGDQSLKAHLSSEPDVRHVPIDQTIEFVILASDGLWKVMKNQEAVNCVRSIKDPQAAAKRLTAEALARKSKDDISCIVIRFRC